MARAKRKLTKPAVKSSGIKGGNRNTKLGYGQICKNYNTLKKIEKANDDEKDRRI